jgi:hypothetical protein
VPDRDKAVFAFIQVMVEKEWQWRGGATSHSISAMMTVITSTTMMHLNVGMRRQGRESSSNLAVGVIVFPQGKRMWTA